MSEHVQDFTATGFDDQPVSALNLNAAHAGVQALKLSACVAASYNSGTNQICFQVPIYGNFCVTSPVHIPASAQLKACVQTCGSFIPTGLKVTLYLDGTAILTKVLWGSC